MAFGIAEIVGLFMIVAGCCVIVGACALVAVALAVAVGGSFLLLAGVLLVYVASALERKQQPARRTASS